MDTPSILLEDLPLKEASNIRITSGMTFGTLILGNPSVPPPNAIKKILKVCISESLLTVGRSIIEVVKPKLSPYRQMRPPSPIWGNNAAAQTHILPDLDGEIYLKVPNPFDLNKDHIVNVLDLILVVNNFGESDPDLNSDGVVNILDLVLVVQEIQNQP